MKHSIHTEEGRTLLKNFQIRLTWTIGAWLLLAGLFVGGFCYIKYRYFFSPLQSLYWRSYLWSAGKSSWSATSVSEYKLLVRIVPDPAAKTDLAVLCRDGEVEPVFNVNGEYARTEHYSPLFTIKPNIFHKDFGWQKRLVNDASMWSQFRDNIYGGKGLIELTYTPLGCGLIVFVVGCSLSVRRDIKKNREYVDGEEVRGTRELSPKDYCKGLKGIQGLGIRVFAADSTRLERLDRLRTWWTGITPSFKLWIPPEEENEHILILGDPGTGKSQLIHHFLSEIAGRKPAEAVICYDPVGEFLRHHFSASRGDIVLNPLDARFPYWQPSGEVRAAIDRELIAQSFFPGRERQSGTERFFMEAKRSLFARMLEFNPSAEQIVKWLQDEDEIDALVKGTELARLIDPSAPNQRSGVLGDLSLVARALKHLPSRQECSDEMCLTEWVKDRRGWIFITSSSDTRSQLRPLHVVFLDVLMKRLMSNSQGINPRPCWLIVDEAHSLERLPALNTAVIEGRKHGVKVVLGTQNKAQLEEYYGPHASTMTAAPHLKVFFRSGESNSARWIADTIGDLEKIKHPIGTTATVSDNGRDSINYSTVIENRVVVSKEQIMSLPKLHAYWKHEGKVVLFRLPICVREVVAGSFEPRGSFSILDGIIDHSPIDEKTGVTSDQINPKPIEGTALTAGEMAYRLSETIANDLIPEASTDQTSRGGEDKKRRSKKSKASHQVDIFDR